MIERIKKLSNPYSPITHKINSNEFVGREDQVDLLRNILEEYKTTQRIGNVLISGEKSVGKSTLLNRFKDILHDNNFVIYETELSIDESTKINEFEFFKEMYEDLFRRFSPPEGKFFDTAQCEMWFDLTLNKYQSEMPISERILLFPTQYANLKNRNNEILSYKNIESDFNEIISKLTSVDVGFSGYCIVIDEFQELEKNTFILDTLRKLSDKFSQFFVIGAGLPTFSNHVNFQKFVRTSVPINLNNLDEKGTIDLISKPLEIKCKLSRYDALNLFDKATLNELIRRTSGNPLHIRILCSYLFDAFKQNKEQEKMSLNRNVMEKVMDYYCNVSLKSRKIKSALETSTPVQLKAFKDLYQYEGLTLKSIIFLENAFDSLQSEHILTIKDKLFNNLEIIEDLGLFAFSESIKTVNLKDYTIDQLSQIKYHFTGEEIDKLYTSLYYQDLTEERLIESIKNYEILLSRSLSRMITDVVSKTKLKNIVEETNHIWRLDESNKDEKVEPEQITKEFSILEEYNEEDQIKESQKDDIRKLTKKYNLDIPAYLSSFHAYEGYYLIISSFLIRGKRKISYNLIPVKIGISETVGLREKITEIHSQISASIEEYSIKLEWVYLYWWPKNPLYLVYYVNISDEAKNLYNLVNERKYDEATDVSKNIHLKSLKLKESKLWGEKDKYNNFGYCLINIGSLDEAIEIFEKTKDVLLISQINCAYIYHQKNKTEECKSLLKRIVRKKLGMEQNAQYLHLTLNHAALEHGDKQVENVSPYNIACWNLAIIASQEGNDVSSINSYLKKVNSAGKSSLTNRRVLNWIDYYCHQKEKALQGAQRMLSECNDDLFCRQAVEIDIKCFS